MTGLTWQCDCQGPMTWGQALEYAEALSLEDRKDWRLPSARELETLLDRARCLHDRARYRPLIREEVPFKDTLSYWSSTTFGHQTKSAWIVMFDGAYVLSYYKNNTYYVRCVRG